MKTKYDAGETVLVPCVVKKIEIIKDEIEYYVVPTGYNTVTIQLEECEIHSGMCKEEVNQNDEQPIAYDVDKVVEKLESDSSVKLYGSGNSDNYLIPVKRAIEIVKEVKEEYKGGCIPCGERRPDKAFGCFGTVIDCNPVTQTDFENILPWRRNFV